MSDEGQANKGVYETKVRWNRQIGDHFWKLAIDFAGPGAEAMAEFNAGQFAQLDVSGAALPPEERIPEELRDVAKREVILRRPFSFCDVSVRGNKTRAELLYCVVGPATLRMTTLRERDSVSVVGPLGNGFWVPEGKKIALLVGGGMGTPPLQCMAKVLTEEHSEMNVLALAGAKSAEELPFEGRKMDGISQHLGFAIREFARFGIESLVATDDGSAGYKGFVTDCVRQWLGENEKPAESIVIYACGPEPMLAKVAEIAKEKNIECQVSMERRMGCGIGLCQSCAVECRKEGSEETAYKLCCKDGPVFEGREVVFKV